MSNPLQNNPTDDKRRNTGEKILGVLDIVHQLVQALLNIFGRRKSDHP
jgi:hypothetical protein